MPLVYSTKPQLHYGSPSRVDKVIARIPQGAQPIGTAPQASAVPIQVIDGDGKASWCLYHRDCWRKLEPHKDGKYGSVSWRMNGEFVRQPIAWIPRQRGR
jgi:hypothetical protein